MKKALALVLLVVLGLPMLGCGAKQEPAPSPPAATGGAPEGGAAPAEGATPAAEEKKE